MKHLNLVLLNSVFSLPSAIPVYFLSSFSIWVCFSKVVMRSFPSIFPFLIILTLFNPGLGRRHCILAHPWFSISNSFRNRKISTKVFEILQGRQPSTKFEDIYFIILVKHRVILWNIRNLGHITTKMKQL